MRGLRGLMVLSVALLVGCAEHKTLEELELAALQSGDWTAVEKRERAIAKRKARQAFVCAGDAIAVCESRGGDSRCECASHDAVRDMLGHW